MVDSLAAQGTEKARVGNRVSVVNKGFWRR